MILFGLAIIITEIIARSVFHSTIYVADEYAGYLASMLSFMALAYTLKEKEHIRMSFLHSILSPRKRIFLDLVCYLVGFCVCMLLLWATSLFCLDSILSGTKSMQVSETPLAIPEMFIPLGALMLGLQFLAEFGKELMILRTGDSSALSQESAELGR